MRRYNVLTALAVLGCVAGFGHADVTYVGHVIEPAYSGPFGNPEETALRPYKWFWHGLKSLGYHTKDQFIVGNMKFPVVGTAQTFRGVRRGTFELIEDGYHGLAFAPVPPKGKKSYQNLDKINTYAESDVLLRNVSDLMFSWWFFPVQKVVDHYPLESDEKVQIRLENARQIRLEQDHAHHVRKGTMHPENEAVRVTPPPKLVQIGDHNVNVNKNATTNTSQTVGETGSVLKIVHTNDEVAQPGSASTDSVVKILP